MAVLNERSQLDMLQDQIIRCDDEMLLFLKRRLQTSKKLADVAKKNGLEFKEISNLMSQVHFKSSSKCRELGFDMSMITELLGIIEDTTAKVQKQAFEK